MKRIFRLNCDFVRGLLRGRFLFNRNFCLLRECLLQEHARAVLAGKFFVKRKFARGLLRGRFLCQEKFAS